MTALQPERTRIVPLLVVERRHRERSEAISMPRAPPAGRMAR
jgi:hypothetical protein